MMLWKAAASGQYSLKVLANKVLYEASRASQIPKPYVTARSPRWGSMKGPTSSISLYNWRPHISKWEW